MLSSMRGGKNSIFIYILFGLLAVGLIGFGANNGGAVSRNDIGKVGDTQIPLRDYANQVQNQTAALSRQFGRALTQAEAEQLGIFRSALAQVIATTALDNEANKFNLSVGDAAVSEEIRANPNFSRLSGQFDPDAYRLILQNNGFSVSEFEEETRSLLARSLLETAIYSGLSLDDRQAINLGNYAQEERQFTWAAIDNTWLPSPIDAPAEDVLVQFHADNEALFTLPQTSDITYLHLKPETLMDAITVNEDDLRADYEVASDRFTRPAIRVLDRLVLSDAAQAESVAAQIADGTLDFDALVEERGLTLDAVDMGDVTQDALDPEVGAAIFGSDELGIFGPFDSLLGPVIYRVNASLAGEVTTFEEARAELEAEAKLRLVQQPLSDEIEAMDDLLASGASLEEIAKETQAELGQIDYTLSTAEGIAAYDEFREIANIARVEDFPELLNLADGGVVAMRVNEIREPMLEPYEQAQDKVLDAWRSDEAIRVLTVEAEKLSNLISQGTSFETLGLTATQETALRSDFIEGLGFEMIGEIFAGEIGETFISASGDQVFIAQLDQIDAFDPSTEENQATIERVTFQIEDSMARDIMALFASSIEQSDGLTIDQNVLNSVNSQIFSGGVQ